MPVGRDELFYNMEHKRRGTAVILNHEHFAENMGLKSRAGTNVDRDNLMDTLTRLGFEVQVYNDLTVDEVMQVIDTVSQQDHSDSDCLLVACLSYGDQGILYASNAAYKAKTLWSPFTADKCSTLAGKPKLFFIQACPVESDVGAMPSTQVDCSPSSYKIPAHADFLIAFSTISGFYSWNNTTRGTWFMQALCEELNDNAYTLEMLALLTFVIKKVAHDYGYNVPNNAEKQIPCISFMLTRGLKFIKKEQESNDIPQ